MYVPDQFKMTEQADVLALMQANPFAALVSHDSDGITATHLPTIVRRAGEMLIVECHVARPNPHWKRLAAQPDAESLMIFSGPDAYIRPGWYPSKAENGKVVPTWNYAIVHAYGRAEIIEDGEWLLRHVTELSTQQESPYALPWKPGDAPAQFIAGLIRGIVGIRFAITRIDAKAKLGQNRDDRDALGAADGLVARGEGMDAAVSAMMRAARG
ncbi:MAG TPA: FMN-binding negative transcriptional regulator [Dongiaceae bacterium]|jgi:transcriptional regulator|nr:FMN-binding negative transcriptional regulator [Dongiaceae bacterium]